MTFRDVVNVHLLENKVSSQVHSFPIIVVHDLQLTQFDGHPADFQLKEHQIESIED